MLRSLSLAALLTAALVGLPLATATQALAHAALVSEMPAAGTTVTASPTELRLSFSETLELSFSKVAVKGADGNPVMTGTPELDPNDAKTLIVPLTSPLPKGSVTIEWTAVSADGHKTKGSYTLTIAG